MATQIIYGWLSGKGEQLYVYDKGFTWGVTYKPGEARRFPSVKACIDHYMSKHCQQERYEKFTRDGTVKYFDTQRRQAILF